MEFELLNENNRLLDSIKFGLYVTIAILVILVLMLFEEEEFDLFVPFVIFSSACGLISAIISFIIYTPKIKYIKIDELGIALIDTRGKKFNYDKKDVLYKIDKTNDNITVFAKYKKILFINQTVVGETKTDKGFLGYRNMIHDDIKQALLIYMDPYIKNYPHIVEVTYSTSTIKNIKIVMEIITFIILIVFGIIAFILPETISVLIFIMSFIIIPEYIILKVFKRKIIFSTEYILVNGKKYLYSKIDHYNFFYGESTEYIQIYDARKIIVSISDSQDGYEFIQDILENKKIVEKESVYSA